MFEHLTLRGVQLVLNSVGHMSMEVVVQSDYSVNEFTLAFVPDLCMQVLWRYVIA
jgi:hypothetical protein